MSRSLRQRQLKMEASLTLLHEHVQREVSCERLRSVVEQLPAPRNRRRFPEAMAVADDLLVSMFQEAGWEVERRPFTFLDAPGISDEDDGTTIIYGRLDGANIVARKPGTRSSDVFVVLAHFDTVNMSPGADDNTASVAALLELARVLMPYRFKRTVLLAAVDMEEIGFFGAKALVTDLHQERHVMGCVNFETMAYTDSRSRSQVMPRGIGLLYPRQIIRQQRRNWIGDFTAIIYNGPASRLASALSQSIGYERGKDRVIQIRDPTDLPILGGVLARTVPNIQHFARSDHREFWEVGIPALMISDTANFRNPHYHTSKDVSDTLDYPCLAAIVRATALIVAKWCGVHDVREETSQSHS